MNVCFSWKVILSICSESRGGGEGGAGIEPVSRVQLKSFRSTWSSIGEFGGFFGRWVFKWFLNDDQTAWKYQFPGTFANRLTKALRHFQFNYIRNVCHMNSGLVLIQWVNDCRAFHVWTLSWNCNWISIQLWPRQTTDNCSGGGCACELWFTDWFQYDASGDRPRDVCWLDGWMAWKCNKYKELQLLCKHIPSEFKWTEQILFVLDSGAVIRWMSPEGNKRPKVQSCFNLALHSVNRTGTLIV